MSQKWKEAAYEQVLMGQIDPDHTPRYRVPARGWWQFWKPRWKWVEGLSQNQVRRACGLTASNPKNRS